MSSSLDPIRFGDIELSSRFLMGTAGYPSPQILESAIQAGQAEVLTMGIKRQAANVSAGSGKAWWDLIRKTGKRILPNTAGCRTAAEAIALAQMAREIFETPWVKLEVVGDDHTLQPDSFELVAAASKLIELGFEVFPYCTEDIIVAQRLVDAGCRILMPWAAPIGSGQGITNREALIRMRDRFPSITLIVDAGIGAPSHAAEAMEIGFDGVLLNSAIDQAKDPVQMAAAFRDAISAGRAGYLAGVIPPQAFATPSTPVTGQPFSV
ncbi:MAG: thiazole synthase [Betaproteobacteria bacterium]